MALDASVMRGGEKNLGDVSGGAVGSSSAFEVRLFFLLFCNTLSLHKHFVNATHKLQPQESIEMSSCTDGEITLEIKEVF